jgi:serine/threonine-protein kinase
MEFIPGRSLAALSTERTFDLAAVQPIVEQIAGALDALHDGGLLHRDIKPANIMLREDGRAVLVDLGVAGLADAAGPTTRNMILGTPGFLAPEQVAGSAGADARTDVYQLAATAYTLLAGRPPFQGETAHVLYAVAHESPPDLHELCPDLPAAVCAVIDQALAKDPMQRPARASEFAARLTDAMLPPTLLIPLEAVALPEADAPEEAASLPSAGTVAPVMPPIAPLPVPVRRHRHGRRALIAAGVGATVILFVGGAAIVGAGRNGGASAAPPATPEWQEPVKPAATEPQHDMDDRRQAPRTSATGRPQETITTARPTATETWPSTQRTTTPSAAPEATPAPRPSASPAPPASPTPWPSPTPEATPAPRLSPSPSPSSTSAPKSPTATRTGYGTTRR